MKHTPKPPRREDPLQDARLRARLTAQTPKTRDLWPAVAARLQEPPPRRPARRAALLLAAAVALAALLMGAAGGCRGAGRAAYGRGGAAGVPHL